MPSRPGSDHMLFRLVVVFLLLALCIGSAGYFYYVSQKQHIKKNIADELSAIADLKVNQITTWRKERLGDANVIAKNAIIASAVRQFLQNPESVGAEGDVLQWLKSLREITDYQRILLVDPRGRVRLSTSPADKIIGPHAEQLLRDALRGRKAMLSDFHKVPAVNFPHLDLIAPLIIDEGGHTVPVGAVLIRLNPEEFLYPLIQSWPGASKSAETLLFRREGEGIVFLNKLRHHENPALTLRKPLNPKMTPVLMAVEGKTGTFEGIDYREVPVLAAPRSVPETPWFLIAKIDQEEIYAPLHEQARLIAVAISLLIAAAGLGIGFWWRQQSAEYYRRQYQAELDRKTLSQQYDYLSKYANDIILLMDPAGNIREANDRAVTVYGYSRDELMRLTIRDLRPLATQSDVEAQMKQVREHNGLIFETIHKRKDGATFPVEVSSRVIDADGKSLYQSIIRDITDRKQAEQRLAKLNECLLNFGPDPNWNINRLVALCGEQLGATCALYNRLQGDRLHALGQWNTPPDFNATDRPDGHICYDVIKEGGSDVCVIRDLPMTPYAQTDPNVARYGLKTYIGKAVSFSGKFVGSICVVYQNDRVPSDDELKFLGIVAAAVGGEESRKGTVRALTESEERYKRLVESVTDYIYIVKVEEGRAVGTIHGPGCLNVTGYASEEYEADPGLWLRMIFEEDRGAVIAQTNNILAGASIPPFEHRIIHKNGSLRWVRNTPVPHFDDKKRLIAYDGLITDITQVKLLENQLRQAQKMEAVGQLAGGIAHDFNNILTAVIGYANLLLMKMPAQEAGRTYVEQIISSSERAAHLTNSLLAFSRKRIIDPRPADLNDIIKRVEKLLGRVIGEDITFKTMLAGADLPVLVDSIQIEQILMNLATNARDAMPDGGTLLIETGLMDMGEEFIRAHSYGRPGRYACISVADTGVGMDEKTRSRVFEPFFTTKEVGKGTGLGLSMVYGIIKQHSGYINVSSEPGKGTTFKIYLPVITTTARKENMSTKTIAVRRGTETVLLAEDDAAVRGLARSVLADFGYTVIESVDGEDAVRKFIGNKTAVDLLVLDIIMPKKNGKEAYLEIKNIRPDVKALFMSGYTADIIHKKEILETGMDFVLKPIAPPEFLQKVREVLDRK